MALRVRIPFSRPWLLWGAATSIGGVVIGVGLFGAGDSRRFFLPGATSDGHYQIELQCEACHQSSFTSQSEMQASCERCHEEELRRAKDSHPKSKFTDPRNAERVARLDARFCVTCHREHVPDATMEAGLTLPRDYCVDCHADIGAERASHRDLPFDGCSDAGCHNFHDNRALYEDFLARRALEPELLPEPLLPRANDRSGARTALTVGDANRSAADTFEFAELSDWARSGHGRSGVNCTGCHGQEPQRLDDPVPLARCGECHTAQVQGWHTGKHGLRTARGLPAMGPGQARAAMFESAQGRLLSCEACHPAHAYDARAAAVDACLGCHADEHSRAYGRSPHAASFRDELLGFSPSGSGVSCASCHMPRQETEDGSTLTQHNQNDTLRPSEKMLRGVCNRCHGLGFSIDALADAELVRSNFSGKPKVHVASIEMAKRRAAREP